MHQQPGVARRRRSGQFRHRLRHGHSGTLIGPDVDAADDDEVEVVYLVCYRWLVGDMWLSDYYVCLS